MSARMTTSEVAEVFRVDPKTVTRWAKSGKIPSIRTPGGQYRFLAADIDDYLNEDVRETVEV